MHVFSWNFSVFLRPFWNNLLFTNFTRKRWVCYCLIKKERLDRVLLNFLGSLFGHPNWYTDSKSALNMALTIVLTSIFWLTTVECGSNKPDIAPNMIFACLSWISSEESGTYQGNLVYFLVSFLKVSIVRLFLFFPIWYYNILQMSQENNLCAEETCSSDMYDTTVCNQLMLRNWIHIKSVFLIVAILSLNSTVD